MDSTQFLPLFQANHDLYEQMVGKLIETAPVKGVFIDCGAHQGKHTATMLARSDVQNVVAIEAIPSLFDAINCEFSGDSRLVTIQAAVSDSTGFTEFSVASGAMGYSGIRQRDIGDVHVWEKIKVPLTTLDAIKSKRFPDLRVGFIKLDVEGAEFSTIKGGRQLIQDDRPFIVFENGLAGTAATYDYGPDEFFSVFDELEYTVFDFFGNVVDMDYWCATLTTYMFVAVPSDGSQIDWYRDQRQVLMESLVQTN